MINVQAELTEAVFKKQECPVPDKQGVAAQQAVDGTLNGIVTFIKLPNGKYQIMSRFEDDAWRFPASEVPSGTNEYKQRLDFTKIKDEQAKQLAKWVLWNERNRGVAVGTLRNIALDLTNFLCWIASSETLQKQGLTVFSAQAYMKYVNEIKVKRKGQLKPLTASTKAKKFSALELIHKHCQAFEFVKEHPWPESSSSEKAGNVGTTKESRLKPKTPLIPDEVLQPLCLFTKDFLDRADELLDLRDKLDAFKPTSSVSDVIARQKLKFLKSLNSEYQKLNDLNKELVLLRDSCIFWLLLTTGMRIHEVAGIKRGAYRTETKEGETYYYIETVSDKTYTGLAEWIAPKIAIDAIKILERYSSTLQERVDESLTQAKANNDRVEIDRLEAVSDKVLLSLSKLNSRVEVLSTEAITNIRLPNLCAQINSEWNLSAHQFRRTFANYVVHSELGDLRALKDHFKHWSITMTALYAYNDHLDQELFEELLREKYLVEEQIKFDWFELDTPLAGGAIANRIMQVRGDDECIKTFKTREDMVRAFSSNIPIRSTGIAWCTNDDDGCMGGKCDECDHGIVDKNNQKHWQGMLIQQFELAELRDIGEAGKAAVAKGAERCEKVLRTLGVDVEKMKVDFRNKNQAA